MDEAAAFTLEVESYLTVCPPHQHQVSTVSEVPQTESGFSPVAVAAIHTQRGDAIIEMLHTLTRNWTN